MTEKKTTKPPAKTEVAELDEQALESVEGGIKAPFDLGLTGPGPAGGRALRDIRIDRGLRTDVRLNKIRK